MFFQFFRYRKFNKNSYTEKRDPNINRENVGYNPTGENYNHLSIHYSFLFADDSYLFIKFVVKQKRLN